MLKVEIGENSARAVALQILLNRSRSIIPKLTTDGDLGGKTRAAVDTFRDKEMRASGPPGVADPAMWRFMLARTQLQVVDAIDVTDPSLLEQVVPEVEKWTDPIVLGGLSNGVEQLVQEVRARVRGERSLLMLRLHGHGSPGLAAISHGSRRVSPGIDPIAAQSIIALALMPTLLPLLQRLEPLFHDFGFVELHSCRVGLGTTGATFVRRFADALQAPVRAALSRQEAPQVFTLTGPTVTGIPGGGSLRNWGFSRQEGVRSTIGPPRPPPQAGRTEPREGLLISTD